MINKINYNSKYHNSKNHNRIMQVIERYAYFRKNYLLRVVERPYNNITNETLNNEL